MYRFGVKRDAMHGIILHPAILLKTFIIEDIPGCCGGRTSV